MSPALPKKPLLALNRMLGHSTAKNHMTKPRIGDVESLNDERQQRELQEQRASRREEGKRIYDEQPEEVRARYGSMRFDQLEGASFRLRDLTGAKVAQTVAMTARLHHVRAMSARLIFILLRQELYTVQAVLQSRNQDADDGAASDDPLIHWVKHLHSESLVRLAKQMTISADFERINDADRLAARMDDTDVPVDDMREYVQAFECAAPPHAGCGIGLERLLFLLLDLGDIRNASLFPRDPKSLSDKSAETSSRLPHPEADTIAYSMRVQNDGGGEGEDDCNVAEKRRRTTTTTKKAATAAVAELPPPPLPPGEKLIANYGDATNTSWLDDRYEVWRDELTGAAIGYAADSGYALIMGNPLCDERQYPVVIGAFLRELRRERDLRPVWLLVSREVRDILGWQTMSCIAEERVDTASYCHAGQKAANKKKERQAAAAGLKIHELPPGADVPGEVRRKIDKRIEDWMASRQDRTQVHLTEVQPWVDLEHRVVLWSEDQDARHGYQVKFALDFPGAPSGGIEALIGRALERLAAMGVRRATFGAGATPEMEVGQNVGRVRGKVIARTYRHVAAQLRLAAKSDFRKKFGAEDGAVYICYPSLGLGVSGARTLVKFFEDEI